MKKDTDGQSMLCAAPVPEAGAEQQPAMSLERKKLIAQQIVGDDPQSQVTALRIINAVLFDLGAFAPEAGGHAAAPSDDAEHAAWLADKIVALGDYAKEAAAMLRRWPSPVGINGLTEAETSATASVMGLVHLAAPQTSGPTGGHRGQVGESAPSDGGSEK